VSFFDTARRFNRQDAMETVLVHADLGLGPKRTDPDRGLEYPTLARRAVAAKMNDELLSEEMRVLYVALTRAKERLLNTCALPDAEAALDKLRPSLRSPIPPQALQTAPSMAHWLLQAAALPQNCLRLVLADAAAALKRAETEIVRPAADGEPCAAAPKTEFRYPYAAAWPCPPTHATERRRGLGRPDGAPLLPSGWRAVPPPELG
jgi:ATP-dependent helicase/nuclease subunit A